MSFCSDNHVAAIASYAKKAYGKNVFSNHFVTRSFQRVTPQDRGLVFAEIRDLAQSNMLGYFFGGSEEVELLLRDKYKVVFTRNGTGRLVVKTIFEPSPSQRARMMAALNSN